MNADDPKFTAHVLGEFEDLTPAERAEIEALIANDPTAAAEAAETRALVARLRAELPGEAAGALQEEQRAAVLEAMKTVKMPAGKVVRFPRWATVAAALAACVIVGVSYSLLFRAYESQQAKKSNVAASEPIPTFDVKLPADPADQSLAANPVLAAPVPLSTEAKIQQEIDKGTLIAGGPPSSRVPVFSPTMEQENPVSKAMPAPAVPAPIASAASSDPSGKASIAAITTANTARPIALTMAPNVQTKGRGTSSMSASTRYDFESASGGLVSKDSAPGLDGTFKKSRPNESADEEFNTTSFDAITENAFLSARENPLSTFSIDVDTASYAIVRRFLNENRLPPKGAVRVEELLNYFTYDYPQPKGDAPFSATMEVAGCPWAPEHRLVRVGLKGHEVPNDQRPPSNLVFLIDVSGSMNMPNKLPLLQQCFSLLVEQLGPKDRVAIVTYAGRTGVALESTQDKEAIQQVVDRLHAGGSTNGASGVRLAYQMAEKHFIKGGTNRVILATDGDWNVGITNQSELLDMIAEKAKSGVFLTVLGFGMDNLKDSMLVKLADRGNGHYAYIDTPLEAKKVFVEQLSGTLVTIAKDVKIQVEFNPAQVGAYRLIGYEKRMLAKEDFNDDKKDAGEIGAGHTVTALYEVVPAGKEQPEIAMVDKLKYQPRPDQLQEVKKPKRNPDAEPQEALAAPAPAPANPEPALRPIHRAIPVEKPVPAAAAAPEAEAAGRAIPALPALQPRQSTEKLSAERYGSALHPESTPMERKSGLNKITAVTTSDGRVTMTLDKAEADGSITHTIALADRAEPVADTGEVFLYGMPDVTQGTNRCIATSPQTWMKLTRDGRMEAHGPHRTIIVDTRDGAKAALVVSDPSGLPAAVHNEMLTLKLRYKAPDGEKSKLLEFPLTDRDTSWEKSSPDFHFAAAVAGYGMLLRDSSYRGEATWQSVAKWAHEGLGADKSGYRAEFLSLLDKAKALKQ